MANIFTTNPIKIIGNTISRYNFVIFVVIISCGLMLAIIVMTSILNIPFTSVNGTETKFDQVTINRLSKFETISTNTGFNNLPTGRINPFFE